MDWNMNKVHELEDLYLEPREEEEEEENDENIY